MEMKGQISYHSPFECISRRLPFVSVTALNENARMRVAVRIPGWIKEEEKGIFDEGRLRGQAEIFGWS